MNFNYQILDTGWKGSIGETSVGASIHLHTLQDIQLPIKSFKKQIHGSDVFDIDTQFPDEGDGLVTHQRQTLLMIQTADCVPIHFFDGNRIGMVHAGWRGIRAGIHRKALQFFDIKNTHIILGPAISENNYVVKEDVILPWLKKSPDIEVAVRQSSSENGYYLDLKKVITLQLIHEGVLTNHIHDVAICTYDHPKFPSYRKNGPNQGRLHNFIYK